MSFYALRPCILRPTPQVRRRTVPGHKAEGMDPTLSPPRLEAPKRASFEPKMGKDELQTHLRV